MKLLLALLGLPPGEYNDWEIHWALSEAGWLFPAMGVFFLLALWFFWTSLARVTSPLKKGFLFSLRILAFALLIFVLLQPSLEMKQKSAAKNAVAVLLDDSLSMSIKTLPAGKRRFDLVREALDQNPEYFARLKENYRVEFYLVSDQLRPAQSGGMTGAFKPLGVDTDFGGVLKKIQERYPEDSLRGMILFSDGADLTQLPNSLSPDLEELVTGFQAPIHTFQAGNNEGFKDLGIERAELADFGFVFQPASVTVTLVASSMGEKNVPLVLKEGNKILASKIVEIRPGQTRYQVEMAFTPEAVGKRIYRLSVPLFAGESIESNNAREFQLQVVRDRLRILHLNGRPSWDTRFLREVLINNPKVDLLSFFILRTLSDDVAATTGELSLIPFPSNLLFTDYLYSFDLIIFHNFKYAPFIDKKYLLNIKRYVENGGAFLMVGGDLSFQNGGYRNTPIEDILPVRFKSTPDGIYQGKFQLLPPDRYANHPLFRLEKDSDASRRAWRSLPVLNGLNGGLIPKKRAQVLAAHSASGKPLPVLAAMKSGKGRTFAVATDSLWNWNFRSVGQGGSGRYYQKFWSNLLAWLTDDPATRLIQIETDKEQYSSGEKVLIQFKVLKEDYNPDPDRPVKLSIRSISKKQDLLSEDLKTDAEGEGSFEFHPAEDGFYSVKIEAERDEEILSSQAEFRRFSQTLEFERPLINAYLLKKLAEKTGGLYQVLKTGEDWKEPTFPRRERFADARSKTIGLSDNWWAYGLIVGFLFVDWWLRRRAGLS